MKTLPIAIWMDLLGKPFREGARGPHEYDCVGLLIEIERRLGRTVPPWGSSPQELAGAKASWEPITDPAPGDAVLIIGAEPPWHIGVVVGDGWMIHASKPAGSVVRERYNCFPWHNRIEGFYQWKRA